MYWYIIIFRICEVSVYVVDLLVRDRRSITSEDQHESVRMTINAASENCNALASGRDHKERRRVITSPSYNLGMADPLHEEEAQKAAPCFSSGRVLAHRYPGPCPAKCGLIMVGDIGPLMAPGLIAPDMLRPGGILSPGGGPFVVEKPLGDIPPNPLAPTDPVALSGVVALLLPG